MLDCTDFSVIVNNSLPLLDTRSPRSVAVGTITSVPQPPRSLTHGFRARLRYPRNQYTRTPTREGSGPFQRPLPFKRLTFGPLSLYDLRHRLGVPQDLGVFERYSDLAWFAAGKSADSMHILQQAGFFPEFGLCVTHSPPVLWEAKLGGC